MTWAYSLLGLPKTLKEFDDAVTRRGIKDIQIRTGLEENGCEIMASYQPYVELSGTHWRPTKTRLYTGASRTQFGRGVSEPKEATTEDVIAVTFALEQRDKYRTQGKTCEVQMQDTETGK